MNDHTVKSFGEQLEALSALVAQMGGLAEAQLADAMEGIARRDSTAAERTPNSRLSCQITVKPELAGLIVRMPETQK